MLVCIKEISAAHKNGFAVLVLIKCTNIGKLRDMKKMLSVVIQKGNSMMRISRQVFPSNEVDLPNPEAV